MPTETINQQDHIIPAEMQAEMAAEEVVVELTPMRQVEMAEIQTELVEQEETQIKTVQTVVRVTALS